MKRPSLTGIIKTTLVVGAGLGLLWSIAKLTPNTSHPTRYCGDVVYNEKGRSQGMTGFGYERRELNISLTNGGLVQYWFSVDRNSEALGANAGVGTHVKFYARSLPQEGVRAPGVARWIQPVKKCELTYSNGQGTSNDPKNITSSKTGN